MIRKKAIAVVSGGLDSATLAYLLQSEGYELRLVSFDYGQRHTKELAYAGLQAQRLSAPHDVVDITTVGAFLQGSALTDMTVDVPEGPYDGSSMAVTVVPNRNAILLTIAYGIAVVENAEVVAIGVHAGDHALYPDCRPQFIEAFDAMQRKAVEGCGHPDLHLYAPFIHLKKHEIVALGANLNVPYHETWSCYKGQKLHCGRCGTCLERKDAFQLAGVKDPTMYAA
jgi:7-cyano-7-deazaguanine synthase